MLIVSPKVNVRIGKLAGDISYPLYLVHFPIIIVFGEKLGILLVVAYSLAIATAINILAPKPSIRQSRTGHATVTVWPHAEFGQTNEMLAPSEEVFIAAEVFWIKLPPMSIWFTSPDLSITRFQPHRWVSLQFIFWSHAGIVFVISASIAEYKNCCSQQYLLKDCRLH